MKKTSQTETESWLCQLAVYFRSRSEAPGYIVTEAVLSHNSGFHTAAEGASLHVLAMAQRLITHPEWKTFNAGDNPVPHSVQGAKQHNYTGRKKKKKI